MLNMLDGKFRLQILNKLFCKNNRNISVKFFYQKKTNCVVESLQIAEKLNASNTCILGDDKVYLKYVNNKKRIRESTCSLLYENGYFTNRYIDKAEIFHIPFASIFNTNDRGWDPSCPELQVHDYDNN